MLELSVCQENSFEQMLLTTLHAIMQKLSANTQIARNSSGEEGQVDAGALGLLQEDAGASSQPRE